MELNYKNSLVFFILLVNINVIFFVSPTEAVRNKPKNPIELNEDSWTQLLKGEWMVDFYAPWCPACKSLTPEWQQLAEWSEDLNINVASADVTANPGLSGRFMVSGLPTIYHVKEGVFRVYNGPRNHKAMIDFVEQQAWKSIQPISRWFAPESLQMSFVAHSFRISMALRDIHKYLVEHIGLPYYVSYLIFALGTVALGTLLGLLIVFIIDMFCPSPRSSSEHDTRSSKKSDDNTSDLDDTEGADDSSQTNTDGKEKLTRRRVNN